MGFAMLMAYVDIRLPSYRLMVNARKEEKASWLSLVNPAFILKMQSRDLTEKVAIEDFTHGTRVSCSRTTLHSKCSLLINNSDSRFLSTLWPHTPTRR